MQPNVALRGRFILTLTEKSIAIQNMRVQIYDKAVKDDNGSKELVELRNRNSFVKYFIMVLIGLRVVYKLVYKGDTNNSVVQKKMKCFFCVCFLKF